MNTAEYLHGGQTRAAEDKRILVANDFSGASARALVVGFQLARREGSELIVLNVEEDTDLESWSRGGGGKRARKEDRFEHIRSKLMEFISEKLESRGARDVPPLRVEAAAGDPATQIVITAFDNKVDLVVIGDHRKGNPACRHLGRTAEMVVRYSSCSVLVVRENNGELDLPPVLVSRRIQMA